MTRVAITGISSYTGMCIAQAFVQAGADVTGLLSGDANSYGGRKSLRLVALQAFGVKLTPELPAEGGKMATWLASNAFDVWVHHHHPMTRFRAPDYDVVAASESALAPLNQLAEAWTSAGVRSVIYSGTYFEPGEGGRALAEAGTPYACLKAKVGTRLGDLCADRGISFAKIVIPSPTGALENEDRLTPQMLLSAQRSEPFPIRSPDSVFDNIPGEELARTYVRAATQLLEAPTPSSRIYRPSGWAVSAAEWAEWVNAHIARPLGVEVRVEVPDPDRRPAPTTFRNPNDEAVSCDWDSFAIKYATEFRQYFGANAGN